MNLLEHIEAAGALPGPRDEDPERRREALVARITDHLRDVLEALPDDNLRQAVMIGCAVCLGCGFNHRRMYEQRGWYTCDCHLEKT